MKESHENPKGEGHHGFTQTTGLTLSSGRAMAALQQLLKLSSVYNIYRKSLNVYIASKFYG
jgi:hypothetical protein